MEKYYCDYHIHSMYSFDSSEYIKRIIDSAEEKCLKEICITEHHSFDSADPSFKYLDYETLRKDVDDILAMKNYNLKVKVGVELGEGHLYGKDFINWAKNRNIDFVIGSIHNMGDLTIRKTINRYGVKVAYERYFDEVLQLCKIGELDVLGHLDLVQRYSYEHSGIYEFDMYREQIQEILITLIQRGKGIEINTSGMDKDMRSLHPRKEILQMYKELKGEIITVGSDAHNAQRVGAHVKDTYELLETMGFKYISTFDNRKSTFVRI